MVLGFLHLNVIYSDELDVDKYESWMTMLLVKITDSKVRLRCTISGIYINIL
jgi:hypothetical protein